MLNKLKQHFEIEIVNKPEYNSRLKYEIELLEKMDLTNFLLKFIHIFKNHIKSHLYLLRGSAGSSLLLYYLGINKLDPIKYNISLLRFMNKTRKQLPDIDIDVPVSLRNMIIDDIINNNNDTIRITRRTTKIQNEELVCEQTVGEQIEEPVIEEVDETNMDDYKLHPSTILILNNDKTDEEMIIKNKVNDNQLKLTKDDVGNFKKIDILSNMALEQLDKINVKINYDFNDAKVFDFISNDDGCGISYAETSLIQYVINKLRPINIEQLSLCLALVRPLAYMNINSYMSFENLTDKIIYDDDLIIFLAKKLNISEDETDRIIRVFKKNKDLLEIENITAMINAREIDETEKINIFNLLTKSRYYGFCKSHSLNYAILLYMLWYCKYYYPKKFWEATIKSINGQYKDWVYIRKGLKYGLQFRGIKKCDPIQHFKHTGYWITPNFINNCYVKIIEHKSIIEISINPNDNKIILNIF